MYCANSTLQDSTTSFFITLFQIALMAYACERLMAGAEGAGLLRAGVPDCCRLANARWYSMNLKYSGRKVPTPPSLKYSAKLCGGWLPFGPPSAANGQHWPANATNQHHVAGAASHEGYRQFAGKSASHQLVECATAA